MSTKASTTHTKSRGKIAIAQKRTSPHRAPVRKGLIVRPSLGTRFPSQTFFSDSGDAMPLPDLIYFTHEVDGRSFAGWFRTVGPGQIEVLGIGLLQAVGHPAHVAPANVARETLARFIRG